MSLTRRVGMLDQSLSDAQPAQDGNEVSGHSMTVRSPWQQGALGNSFIQSQLFEPVSAAPSDEAFPFQAEVESAFGQDLSHLRIRRGEGARLKGMGAQAAQSGEELLFGSGPPTREMVFHEVAHALQRERYGEAPGGSQARFSTPGDSSEREADEVARRGAQGLPVTVRSRPTGEVARTEDPAADESEQEDQQEDHQVEANQEPEEFGPEPDEGSSSADQEVSAEEPKTDWDICPYGGVYVPQDVAALVKDALGEDDWGALIVAVGEYRRQIALAEKVFPALGEAEQELLQAQVDVSDAAVFYLEAAEMRLGVALGYRPTTGLQENPDEGTLQPIAEEQEGMAEEDPEKCIATVQEWLSTLEDANAGLFGTLEAVDAEQVSMNVDVQTERIRNSFQQLFTCMEVLATRSAIAKVTSSAEELATRLEAMPGLMDNITNGLGKLAARELLKEVVSAGVSSLVGVGELKLAYRLIRAGVVVSADYVSGEILELVIDAVPNADTPTGKAVKAGSDTVGSAERTSSFLEKLGESRTIVNLTRILKVCGAGSDAAQVILDAIDDEEQREAVASRLAKLRDQVSVLTESLAASSAKYKELLGEATELAKVDKLGIKGSFFDSDAKSLQHRVAVAPDLSTPTGEQ